MAAQKWYLYICDIFTRHTDVFYFSWTEHLQTSNLPIVYFLSRHPFIYMTLYCKCSGESSLTVAKYKYVLSSLSCQSACQQELDQVLEEISKITSDDNRGPLEDLYGLKFPNCDRHGLYNLKQVSHGHTAGTISITLVYTESVGLVVKRRMHTLAE